ncbi:microcephalin isoform X2 [Coccinella septempunctata]|uniref:microcephalin isoform X2 n=1 Tax=Coccinella septempunctata TaxID=41139 RepID=UPI001D096833|nr:microcephalin isoform X2 [Coccinella septempunctata]
MSRRSEISHKSNNVDFNLSLFEHALKDPASKNVILQLLSANNKNVFELFKPGVDAASSPVRRVKKKEHCESPTALLRRRELEKKNRPERPESAQSHTSEQSTQSSTSGRSSTVPFERILKNVVAYVEINSNGTDRSGGAKALLRSMGATVCEKFTRDVTHVIFKDGLYTTYQRAKLLKVHLVSVLWLEATRRNGVRAQEKNYPALGTKNYDLNVSMICSQMQKDYEDVIREEIRRTLESGTPLPSSKSFMDNRRKTVGTSSKSFDRSSQLASQSYKNNEVNTVVSRIGGQSTSKKVQPPSMTLQDSSPAVSTDEDLSILSKKIHSDILNSSTDSFRPASLRLEQNEVSDSDSECGMIDGHFSQRETVVDDTFTGIAPLQSDEIFPSNMELTCTEDSDSQSIMSNRNRTSNLTASMDLTTPNAGSILQNLKGSILNSLSYITSRNQNATGAVKRKSNEKENYSTSSTNKTPKTSKVNFDRPKSTVKLRKNVEKETFSTPKLENENDSCKDDFYGLETPKLVVQTKKLPKPVNIMNQGHSDEKLAETSTSMSSLRISGDSKEKMGNSKVSNDDSSLRTSTENTKKSNGTSMSSLRLSKSSLENSNLSDVPSLRISPEKQKISDDLAGIELKIDIPEDNEVQTESNPTSSTPFVTERKKRQTRRSVKPDLAPQTGTPVRNTRSSTRVSTVHKEEVEEFKEELENKKDSHDKNKEVELVASREDQVSTPRPARKFPSKTPKKSDVFISPFVNTRRRRKSNARAVEAMDCDQEDSRMSGIGSTRRSTRINKEQSTSTPKEIGKETVETPEVSPEQGLPSEEESEEQDRIVEAKELSNIIEEDENVDNNSSSNKSLKPVVLLQDILVSPPEQSKTIKKKRSEVKPRQDKCVVSLVSISNEGTESSPPKRFKSDDKQLRTSRRTRSALNDERVGPNEKDDERIEVKTERKSRRRTMRVPPEPTSEKDEEQDETSNKNDDSRTQKTQRKISRSKSESDVQNSSRTRKSRRIRKLYDPDQVDEEEEIQERLGVNDQEERKTTREEKLWKVNVKSQNGWLNGNMLMTQKAMEFLGRSQGNVTTLFKEPESVLERLGINNEKKKERKKESIVNNSDDEQVDLAEEFVNKKSRKIPKEDEVSLRTPRTQKSRRNLTQKALTTGNSKRRSTMEFAPTPLSMPRVRTKLNLDQKPTIVCTKMHKADVQVFNQIVKKLGRFEIEDEVSSRTTHLVVGEPKRTVNMLRALARGCWILKQEWLLSSLEERAWLPEEKYEVTEFSPAVQQCRLRRQAFGPTYHMNIFLDCGMIYVAKSTIPRCSDIRELITLCEGKVTKIPDNAKIAVGAYFEGCDCVNEYWVLDSITSGKLEPIDEYVITAESAKTKSPFV